MVKNSYKKELGFSILVTIICALLVICSFSYAKESSQFPRFLTATMLALSLILLVQTLRSRPRQPEMGETDQERSSFWASQKVPFLVFFIAALYVALIPVIGYFTSTILFLVGTMTLFGRHRLFVMLGTSMIFLVVIYALFGRFLGLHLPEGMLF